MCSAKLHTRDICCINESPNCLFKSKTFNQIFYNYNRLKYSIIPIESIKMSSAKVISKITSANGVYYVPFNISGFAGCGDNFELELEKREFIYKYNFEIK